MSRERVLRAAIDLADQAGIDSLTMRRLAQALGVEAMTLCYYVANKEKILVGMVDLVVNRFGLPASGDDWKQGIRRTAVSAHQVPLSHPWAATLLSGSVSKERLRHSEEILLSSGGRLLARDGPSRLSRVGQPHHGIHAVAGRHGDRHAEPAHLALNFLREVPAEEFPYFTEHVETHLAPSTEYTGSEFEFGLDLILDGLERFRDKA